MFKNKSLFAYLNDKEKSINRVDVTGKTQASVCSFLSNLINDFFKDKVLVQFNGDYKPDDGELYYIDKFKLPQEVKVAINNTHSEKQFCPNVGDVTKIHTLFMGKKYVQDGVAKYIVAYQRVRWDQYIKRKGLNLYYNADTFETDNRFGICISDTISCVFKEGRLYFNNFWYAKQVYDLSQYYREATAEDVIAFVRGEKISAEDVKVFEQNADNIVRRKIASINDSGILDTFTARQIKAKAKKILNQDIIKIVDKKILLPNNRKQMKIILQFLDKEIYLDIFTGETYQTNSKRKLQL